MHPVPVIQLNLIPSQLQPTREPYATHVHYECEMAAALAGQQTDMIKIQVRSAEQVPQHLHLFVALATTQLANAVILAVAEEDATDTVVYQAEHSILPINTHLTPTELSKPLLWVYSRLDDAHRN